MGPNNPWRRAGRLVHRTVQAGSSAVGFGKYLKKAFVNQWNLLAFAGGTGEREDPLPNFGRIRNTVTSARQIQFALRLLF